VKAPVVLSSLPAKIQPDRTALLIVDMVNDFVDPQGKTAVIAKRPIEHARAIIPTIRRMVDGAHAVDVPVVYVQQTTLPHHASDSGPWLDARSRATFSVTDICLDGSWGQQIIKELAPLPTDVILKKYRYGAFSGTNLDLMLRGRRIETVICCGVSTNSCVEATAREAFALDYYVVLPAEACGSWSPELHEATLASAKHRYASVCTADDVLAVWAR
jgi:ureidoacrylate peracid hydrolase